MIDQQNQLNQQANAIQQQQQLGDQFDTFKENQDKSIKDFKNQLTDIITAAPDQNQNSTNEQK